MKVDPWRTSFDLGGANMTPLAYPDACFTYPFIQYKPSELAFEYKAIVNVEIGLVLSEDQVLWDTAYVPLTEAFTS